MKKILLALLTSCALVSCEGYFDQLPKTELPSETFYTSYDAALRNVAILYANAGHVNDGIMTSDRFMMPSLMNEGPFDLTSTSGSVLNLWSKHYSYIAQANLILERLEANKGVIDENAGHSALDKATITGSATEMLMGGLIDHGSIMSPVQSAMSSFSMPSDLNRIAETSDTTIYGPPSAK